MHAPSLVFQTSFTSSEPKKEAERAGMIAGFMEEKRQEVKGILSLTYMLVHPIIEMHEAAQ